MRMDITSSPLQVLKQGQQDKDNTFPSFAKAWWREAAQIRQDMSRS